MQKVFKEVCSRISTKCNKELSWKAYKKNRQKVARSVCKKTLKTELGERVWMKRSKELGEGVWKKVSKNLRTRCARKEQATKQHLTR